MLFAVPKNVFHLLTAIHGAIVIQLYAYLLLTLVVLVMETLQNQIPLLHSQQQ